MSHARYIVGDVFDALREMPDNSVDLVLTSPPFLALRSYLPADHPDKGKEIGSEPSPAAFIDTLLDLTEEWARVLAPHGSLCVELGDTYSGSGGAGGDYGPVGLREGQPAFDGSAARTRSNRPGQYGTTTGPPRRVITDEWPLAKSLCLIPESYRWALVYGRNPFNGRTTPPWRARNVIRWCRPNPPVGALGDKVRPATSDMVVACKSGQRWFDLDAVRTPVQHPDATRTRSPSWRSTANPEPLQRVDNDSHPNGAPPLDHWWHDEYPQDAWLISTEPYSGSHYATWPRELCVRPIEAMCPRRVCQQCGQPSRRIVGETRYVKPDGSSHDVTGPLIPAHGNVGKRNAVSGADNGNYSADTLGWSDCGHDAYRNGVVLDPFAGSGTTLAVATGHGRDAIGIDLDSRNADLARERVGMFLSVEECWPTNEVIVPTGDRL